MKFIYLQSPPRKHECRYIHFFELNNRRRQSNFDLAYEWIHYHVCHSSTFSSSLMSNRRKRSLCRHKEHASLTLMKKNWATNQIQQKVTQNHFMHLWLFYLLNRCIRSIRLSLNDMWWVQVPFGGVGMVCIPITNGCLRVRMIGTFNQALMGKWLWQFKTEEKHICWGV